MLFLPLVLFLISPANPLADWFGRQPDGLHLFAGMVLWCWLALILGIAGVLRLARSGAPFRALAGGVLLQELCLGPAIWMVQSLVPLALPRERAVWWAAGCVLVVLLLRRSRLPEGILPLKGHWLRQLLAAAGVAGLLQYHPYSVEVLERGASITFQAPVLLHSLAPLLLGTALALWMLLWAWRVLVGPAPEPRPTTPQVLPAEA